MTSHLTRGKLNIGLVQEQAKKEFLDLLDNCDGSKVIIWDDGLSGPFGLIAEYSLLKKRDAVKMHPLRPGKIKTIETENVIFITRPHLKLMGYVAENIHHEESSHRKRKWHLYFVPMKSLLCEEFLKNKGVYGSFATVQQISGCILFPFDNDLVSMELESAFREYYVDSDPTCVYQVAKAVKILQDIYGPIKRISGKGNAAQQVMKLLNKLDKEPSSSSSVKNSSSVQIDQLILIDRGIDLLSPLVTQLTYEGLIDELYGISNCNVKLPADRFGGQEEDFSDTTRDKVLILNSADEIFTEIRDKNLFAIGLTLSRRAKQMSLQFDEGQDGRTVQEIKQFVAKLPQMLAVKKCLANHMTVAEMIKEQTDSEDFRESVKNEHEMLLGIVSDRVHPYIEDCMAQKVDVIKVLRLICIQSIVSCGLKPKILEQYKRDIIQTYGFQHILTLTNLEKVGLLKIQQGTRSYTFLRKTLKLTEEETNNVTPKDIHYVHGIYAPLSVRLAQQFAKPNGIRSINDVISALPGPSFDDISKNTSNFTHQRRGSLSSQNDSSNVILVFFIGGCTFAEISALRFLSQQEDLNAEFVIATTKIITGNTFIKSLMEPLS
ncbi:vacuolar protein sorting-associated protein 33A [Planococcus citri]|uniref:vacuolar protein sorting-associated protein 33A n=1 Tax=Planococcus citri TaxID=170843 RepID=UPI0031F9E09E